MTTSSRLAVGFAPLVFLAASCAESAGTPQSPTEDASAVPSVDSAADAGADSDCNADGASSCETPTFYPVEVPVDSRYLLTSIWGSSKDDVWTVGSGGLILHWNGAAWTKIASGTTNTLQAIDGSGPDNLWIVSTRAAIYNGIGLDGSTMRWAPQPRPVEAYNADASELILHSVWVSGTKDIWVGGDAAMGANDTCWNIWSAETSDLWATVWSRAFASSCAIAAQSTTIFGIRAVGTEDVWAVGGGRTRRNGPIVGKTFRTKRGAPAPVADTLAWEELDSQTNGLLFAVWGTSEGGVWAVGENGTIRHYVPGDVRWSIVPSPTTETLRGIWGTGPNDVWAVGAESTVIHFDGESWTPVAVASANKLSLYGIWGSSTNDIWAVGEGALLHLAADGRARAAGAAAGTE